jgi:ABC-type nickel/cobalt efflux system permease component RcnA
MNGKTEGSPIGGIGMNLAVGLVFVSSVLAIISEKFQKVILKENRNFNDIKKLAYFIAFISGIIFIAFTIGNLK